MDSSALRIHSALLMVSAIYGFFYVAVKILLQDIHQSELILMRFVLTALIVGIFEFLVVKSRFTSKRQMLKVFGLGFLGVFIVQILLVLGIQKTTAFHSALIMATIPILTLTFGLFLKREKFRWQKLVGILFAFAGVVLDFKNLVGVFLAVRQNPARGLLLIAKLDRTALV